MRTKSNYSEINNIFSGDINANIEILNDLSTTYGTSIYTQNTSKGLSISALRNDNSFNVLSNVNNTFCPISVDSTGRLYTSNLIDSTSIQSLKSWDPIVSRLGRYTDISNVSIVASALNIDTGEQNFADGLHALNRNLTFPNAASIIGINSNSALDNGVTPNTGARTLLVQGLDSSYNPIQEIVALNGTTKVSTLQSYIIVNQIRTLTAGLTGFNQGYIWVSTNTDTFNTNGPPTNSIYILMAPGTNISRCGFYGVRAGYTLMATESSFSSDSTSAEVINCIAWLKSGITGLIYKLSESYITTSTVTFSNQDSLSIPEKSILFLTCFNKSGSSKSFANIKCVLVKNSSYPNINFS